MVLHERGKINLCLRCPLLFPLLSLRLDGILGTQGQVSIGVRAICGTFLHTQLPRARSDTQTEDVCRDKDFIVLLSAVFDAP